MTHAELDLMIVEVAAQHGRDGHGADGLTGYLRREPPGRIQAAAGTGRRER